MTEAIWNRMKRFSEKTEGNQPFFHQIMGKKGLITPIPFWQLPLSIPSGAGTVEQLVTLNCSAYLLILLDLLYTCL